MANIIVVLIIALCVGSSSFYIYKQKKSGSKCIGCPNAKTCVRCKTIN